VPQLNEWGSETADSNWSPDIWDAISKSDRQKREAAEIKEITENEQMIIGNNGDTDNSAESSGDGEELQEAGGGTGSSTLRSKRGGECNQETQINAISENLDKVKTEVQYLFYYFLDKRKMILFHFYVIDFHQKLEQNKHCSFIWVTFDTRS